MCCFPHVSLFRLRLGLTAWPCGQRSVCRLGVAPSAVSSDKSNQLSVVLAIPKLSELPRLRWPVGGPVCAHAIILGGTLGRRSSGSILGVGAVLHLQRKPCRRHEQNSQASSRASSQSKHGPLIVRGSLVTTTRLPTPMNVRSRSTALICFGLPCVSVTAHLDLRRTRVVSLYQRD